MVVLVPPDLHHERVGPAVDTVRDQPRHHHRVRGRLTHAARPPLCGGERRGMDHELFLFGVVRRRRLQAADVRPVPELRLRVGSDDLQLDAHGQPVFFLLVVALALDRGYEHAEVEVQAAGFVDELSDDLADGDWIVRVDGDGDPGQREVLLQRCAVQVRALHEVLALLAEHRVRAHRVGDPFAKLQLRLATSHERRELA